ncbi:beta-lactamase family protein, partial [bacterium]|nr:beta-lactamase family protein [bacterium]
GMPLPEFADRFLFQKIGISRRDWEELTRGYVNGGAGIDLRPKDLARLGQLYLQGGKTANTQLLPQDWVEMATAPSFSWRSNFGALKRFTYGFLWWVEEGQAEKAYLAWGFGGQFIYVVPDLKLVVVATTNWRRLSQDGGPAPLEQAVLDIIVNHIVPAAR